MIDLHSHILPGIDDGSKDMEMSLNMARLYVENGYERVVSTSHFFGEGKDVSVEELVDVRSKLEDVLNQENIDLEIYLGNELYLSPDILDNLKSGRALSIANSRYILIEMPANEVPDYAENILYEIQIKGYIPIIAHPERNSEIIRNPNILYSLIEKGSTAQLNLHSMSGMYGKDVTDTANLLLNHSLINFVGTDSHSDRRRSPVIKNSLKLIENKLSEKEYFKIVYKNPELVLQDRVIKKYDPEPIVKRSFMNGVMSLW